MYITFLQTSPCEKIVSFLWNSTIVLDTPAESRKAWALKAPPFFDLFSLFAFISLCARHTAPFCIRGKVSMQIGGRHSQCPLPFSGSILSGTSAIYAAPGVTRISLNLKYVQKRTDDFALRPYDAFVNG